MPPAAAPCCKYSLFYRTDHGSRWMVVGPWRVSLIGSLPSGHQRRWRSLADSQLQRTLSTWSLQCCGRSSVLRFAAHAVCLTAVPHRGLLYGLHHLCARIQRVCHKHASTCAVCTGAVVVLALAVCPEGSFSGLGSAACSLCPPGTDWSQVLPIPCIALQLTWCAPHNPSNHDNLDKIMHCVG